MRRRRACRMTSTKATAEARHAAPIPARAIKDRASCPLDVIKPTKKTTVWMVSNGVLHRGIRPCLTDKTSGTVKPSSTIGIRARTASVIANDAPNTSGYARNAWLACARIAIATTRSALNWLTRATVSPKRRRVPPALVGTEISVKGISVALGARVTPTPI